MPRFRFIAMDSKGAETDGILDAENQTQAITMIRTKGLFPTKVMELGGGAQAKGETATAMAKVQTESVKKSGLNINITIPGLGGRVKAKHLMTLTRQLATLVDAGLPLLRGLKILLKQEKNQALRVALNAMGESVEGGSTFSEALAQHPKIFDNLFVNMIRAGEAGGVLEVVLTRLAEFMEKAERIKNKIKSAMIYPIVVLTAAVGILTFLLINVIPKFKDIFEDLLEGEALPKLTQFVITCSDMVANHFLILAAVVAVVVVLFKLAIRTKQGRYLFDKIKLKAPVFGPLFSKTAIARFTRTLGTLMTSGVSVLQALNIVRDTSGNAVVAKAIQSVHDAVKEGESMTMPLEASGVFPGMVVSMVDVGEETGALPEMLMRIADNYEEEVDAAVEGLTSIIEPIMIILLAFIIGTIVIAMFVPLISIIGKLGE